MIKKMREWFTVAFFTAVVLGGLIAPLFMPNYGMPSIGGYVYMPTPYL